jgi:hypothetical protein
MQVALVKCILSFLVNAKDGLIMVILILEVDLTLSKYCGISHTLGAQISACDES